MESSDFDPDKSAFAARFVQGGGENSIAADQVSYLQDGTGAVLRTVQSCLRSAVYVEDFGAVGDDGIDDTAAIQNTVNYLQLNGGGTVRFTRGKTYRISGTITNDRLANPSLARVSFEGDDETTTFIHSTIGNAIYIRNAVTGEGEPNASNQSIRGLTILGPNKATNSAGLLLDTVSNIHLENLRIQNFDYGIYAQDMDQSYLKRCEIRFNNQGIFARKNPTPTAASTQPNNWVLIQCGIGSNGNYGAQWAGASTISFFGGIIASNGSNFPPGMSGFGAAFTDCGYEGGVGPNFFGTYFEDNNGIADVIVQSTTVQVTPITQCLYNFVGCSFNRINGATSYSINSIRAVFGQVADVGQQCVNIEGCSFKSLGSYIPNASRPYIAFMGLAANKDNFYERANIYEDVLEKPSIVDQGNMPWVKVSRKANSSVPASIDTVIPLDTSNGGYTWFGGFSADGIVIPEAGTYAFNAQQIFTTQVGGYKRLRVLVNGLVIAIGSVSSLDDVVSACGIYAFASGEVVTISVRQETAGSLTVAGSGIANSYVLLKRIG